MSLYGSRRVSAELSGVGMQHRRYLTVMYRFAVRVNWKSLESIQPEGCSWRRSYTLEYRGKDLPE
ncbi:short-chain oxidoreductase [Moniliophthora roreri]|nr:short-chain oxidoreductase [Moniliophthora roreri]